MRTAGQRRLRLAAALMLATSASAATAQGHMDSATSVDVQKVTSATFVRTRGLFRFSSDLLDIPPGRFGRLGFSLERCPRASSIDVRVLRADGSLISTLSLGGNPPNANQWSSVIQDDAASFELSTGGRLANTCAIQVRLTYRQLSAEYQNVLYGSPAWMQAYEFNKEPGLKALAQSVGILNIFNPATQEAGFCTGFMVNADTLVTNNHCIADQATCNKSVVTFGYRYDERDKLSVTQEFHCQTFMPNADARRFDLAIIKVAGSPGGKPEIGQIKVGSTAAKLTKGDALLAIGYPNYFPEVISKIHCQVFEEPAPSPTANLPIDFGHTCDTDNSNSGSPIFSAQLSLVGVHHWGTDSQDPKWQSANRAIQIDQLRSVLSQLKVSSP